LIIDQFLLHFLVTFIVVVIFIIKMEELWNILVFLGSSLILLAWRLALFMELHLFLIYRIYGRFSLRSRLLMWKARFNMCRGFVDLGFFIRWRLLLILNRHRLLLCFVRSFGFWWVIFKIWHLGNREVLLNYLIWFISNF